MATVCATLPVAVIGAGPVGLAAAAQLRSRGFDVIVFEQGDQVGANLASYRHVRLFSPWRYNIDKVSAAMLRQSGWQEPPPDALPTAGEVLQRYLRPLAEHPALLPAIRLQHSVVSISRDGVDNVRTAGREAAAFVIDVHTPDGERRFRARAVIDSSGTWNQPNPLGSNGVLAAGEQTFAARIRYGMPDILGSERARYLGKRVVVVGNGHSAAGNLIALSELADQAPGTQIAWAIRGDNLAKVFGGGEADGLRARGELGTRLRELRASGRFDVYTRFKVDSLTEELGRLALYSVPEGQLRRRIGDIDEIIVSTGARPNLQMTRELRLSLDYWLESTKLLAPLIDPNEHSCGTVRPHGHRELEHPERGYYAVGARSYGRAPTFLMATGYEQVRSVVAALAGDFAAADDLQLELPETGVCNVNLAAAAPEPALARCCPSAVVPALASAPAVAESSCCGGPASRADAGCCADDESARNAGQSGCGCSTMTRGNEMRVSACCG